MRQSNAFEGGEPEISRAIRDIMETTGKQRIGVGVKTILTGIKTAKQAGDRATRFASFIAEAIADSAGESVDDARYAVDSDRTLVPGRSAGGNEWDNMGGDLNSGYSRESNFA